MGEGPTNDATTFPTVSVVIPAYNYARYLGAAIESVLAQTRRDHELLVVDDGSTDDTRAIVASFGRRVGYHYQPNAGLSAARNTGLRLARGSYIVFLDADDLLEPSFLETLVDVLDAHPAAAAAYCVERYVDENGAPLPQQARRVVSEAEFYETLAVANFLVPHGLVLRRALLISCGGFDASLGGCEDWDVWLRLARERSFVGVPQALVAYRVHAGSMSGNAALMIEASERVVAKHFGVVEGDPRSWPELTRRARAGFHWSAALRCLTTDDRRGADMHLEQMTRMDPGRWLDVETWYELIHAHRRTGYKVIRSAEELDERAAFLRDLAVHIPLAARSPALARASATLGVVAYNGRWLPQARGYWQRALFTDPRLLGDPSLLARWLKSWLGATWLERARRLRSGSLGP